MNFGELKAELQARGFDYIPEARLSRWINRGYHRLCEEYQWPFLRETYSGTAGTPLEVADLRQIIEVIDTDNNRPLSGEDERAIRRIDPALSRSGNPEAWFLTNNTLTIWPAQGSTASILVQYLKVPTNLSSSTDTPVVPERYHNLIVDAAAILALRDDEEWEQAAALKAQYDEEVSHMASNLLNRNYQNPAYVQSTALWWERDA